MELPVLGALLVAGSFLSGSIPFSLLVGKVMFHAIPTH